MAGVMVLTLLEQKKVGDILKSLPTTMTLKTAKKYFEKTLKLWAENLNI
jgi:hypothetical protein